MISNPSTAGDTALDAAHAPEGWLAIWSGTSAIDSASVLPSTLACTVLANNSATQRALLLAYDPAFAPPAYAIDGACAAIFDGVLYNRAELSESIGVAASSDDATLVLRAYRRWGHVALDKLAGIFALIIADVEREELLCVRDPLGVYPLFHAKADRDLLLSTSIDTLVRHPRVSGAINRAALADHLCHRWPDPEETYFAAVRRVGPGHVLTATRNDSKSRRYWNPVPTDRPVDWIGEADLPQFDVLFDQAVARCQALGPAAIWLSGGLDSVSVAAVAADNSRRHNLPTPWALSLAFPDPECNEEVVQRSVAKGLGLPQELVPFDQAVGADGLLQAGLRVSGTWPSPLLSSYLPAYQYLGAAARRHGCDVILTGCGGDEWLTVSPYYAADLIRGGDVPGLYRLWAATQRSYPLPLAMSLSQVLWRYGLRVVLGDGAARSLRRIAPSVYRANRQRRIPAMTPAWIAPESSLRGELDRRVEGSMPQAQAGSSYMSEMQLGLTHALTAMEMEESFEMGRRLGVRIIPPFWDADLVSFLYRTPPEILYRGGHEKGLVRQTLSKRFPQLGFESQKKVIAEGFFQSLVLREGPDTLRSMSGSSALLKLGIVEKNGLESLLRSIFSGKTQDAYHVWDVLNLESWARSRI